MESPSIVKKIFHVFFFQHKSIKNLTTILFRTEATHHTLLPKSLTFMQSLSLLEQGLQILRNLFKGKIFSLICKANNFISCLF